MIKNVFLDLDDTLLDFRSAEREALTQTLIHLGIEPDGRILNRYSELNLEHWKMLERGEITREQVKIGRYQSLFSELGIDRSAEEATAYYEVQLGKQHGFIDGAEQLLSDLKADGYRLYIVSNGTASVQESRLNSTGIKHYFDGIFISQNIGFDKPDARFFERCFACIPDYDSAQSVIVGDSITSDIKGGKNAGIATVWFNPSGAPNNSETVPDYEIRFLHQLPKLLKNI